MSVPAAPSPVGFSEVYDTSVAIFFSNRGNGGRAIDTYQIGYGSSPASPRTYRNVSGATTVSGLSRGTTYYFWVRAHNADGWGPWAPRSSVKTDNFPDAPNPVVLSHISLNSITTDFLGNGDGGSPIIRWELGYGTNPAGPTTIITSTGHNVLTPLAASTTYYFWARGVNAVGNGPWSQVVSAKTVTGMKVKVGDNWHDAIPYVRVGGVWKVAEPWARVAGEWKKTT